MNQNRTGEAPLSQAGITPLSNYRPAGRRGDDAPKIIVDLEGYCSEKIVDLHSQKLIVMQPNVRVDM